MATRFSHPVRSRIYQHYRSHRPLTKGRKRRQGNSVLDAYWAAYDGAHPLEVAERKTQEYAAAVAGKDQRVYDEARAHRNKGGRPPLYGRPMERIKIQLDETHLSIARQVGGGNVAKGVRVALGRLAEDLIDADLDAERAT